MSGSIHYENLNISIAFYFFPVMKNSSNESKDTVCEHETSFLNFVPLYHPVYHSFFEYKNCRVHFLGSPEFDTLRFIHSNNTLRVLMVHLNFAISWS